MNNNLVAGHVGDMFNKDGHCDLYGTEQFMDFMAMAACDFLWTYESSKDNCILNGDLLQVLYKMSRPSHGMGGPQERPP